jgi:hypothetical protein
MRISTHESGDYFTVGKKWQYDKWVPASPFA